MNQRPMVQFFYVSLHLLGVVYLVEKQSVFGNYCKLDFDKVSSWLLLALPSFFYYYFQDKHTSI